MNLLTMRFIPEHIFCSKWARVLWHVRSYQEVIDRYPDSHLAAESYMRMAEYYFDPRVEKDTEQSVVELQKAIKLYQKVLQYRDSKRYDEALYKLGWSYYRLSATDAKLLF